MEREFEIVPDEMRKQVRVGRTTPEWLAAVRDGKTVRLSDGLTRGNIGSYSALLKRQGYRMHRGHTKGGLIVWAERVDADEPA